MVGRVGYVGGRGEALRHGEGDAKLLQELINVVSQTNCQTY
jgi:hypothetical protein